MLTFAHPWLFALLALPLAVKYLMPVHRETRSAVRVPFLTQLAAITGQTPSPGSTVTQRAPIQTIMAWSAWILIITSLARPQYFEPPVSRTIPTRDLLLAIDLSGSMQTEDFKSKTGEMTDRLTAVKQVVDEFLEQRKNDRVGLILFGSGAFVQAPFTNDLSVCRELLAEAQVGMAGPKTALGDAIGLSIHTFERSDQENKVLIVLTDGNDTSSKVPPVDAARIAADKRIQIHTIAVGDPEAAGEEKLDEKSLQQIAQATDGQFFRALDRKQLQQIYSEIDALDTREAETVSYRPRRELYIWPLAAMLLLSVLFQFCMAIRDALRQKHLALDNPNPETSRD